MHPESNPRPPIFATYTAVSFRDGHKSMEINGLSLDAARHIAQVHAAIGEPARIHCESEDYCESFCPHGNSRRGPYASVILVTSSGLNQTVCCEEALQ